MKRFISILQFLTRIPLPFDGGVDEAFHKGIFYFPLVGGVLGLFYYGVAFLSSKLFPNFIASILVLLSMVLFTGGLHLDGVGDTFDGLYSYRDKVRILEIMKDSRLGTNALLAIFFVLVFKLGFISEIIEQEKVWQLLMMPIVGRWLLVIACYKTQSPRQKGMGNLFIGKASLAVVGSATVYTFLLIGTILALFGQSLKIVVIQFAILLFLIVGLRWVIKRIYWKIEGITGDILGAICEVGEVTYLLLIYLGGQLSYFI